MQRTIASPQTIVRRMVRVKSTATSLLRRRLAERRSLSPAHSSGKPGHRTAESGACSAARFLDLRAGRLPPFRLPMELLAVLQQAGHQDVEDSRQLGQRFRVGLGLERGAGRRVGRFVGGPVDRPVLFGRRALQLDLQAGQMVQEGDARPRRGRAIRLPDGRFGAVEIRRRRFSPRPLLEPIGKGADGGRRRRTRRGRPLPETCSNRMPVTPTTNKQRQKPNRDQPSPGKPAGRRGRLLFDFRVPRPLPRARRPP